MKSFSFCLLSLWLTLLVGGVATAQPTRLYVNANATAGANTGLSWPDAFTSLQSALTFPNSQSLTEIWVAGGLYKPHASDRTVRFQIPSGVAVYGGFVGSTPGNPTGETALGQRPAVNPIAGNPSSSTLSGDIDNNQTLDAANTDGVVSFSDVAATTRLDGFVITGGWASDGLGYGGGVRIQGGTPRLANLLITDNRATNRGGGLDADLFLGTMTISDSRITRNQCTQDFSNGGGVYAVGFSSGPDGGTLVITGTDISQNTMAGNFGAGGGLSLGNITALTMVNSTIRQNSSTNRGGGLYTNNVAALTGCDISQNTALTGNGQGGGWAIEGGALAGRPVRVTSTTISQNVADNVGGGLVCNAGNSELLMTDVVVSGNRSSVEGGGLLSGNNSVTLTLTNTTFRDNESAGNGGGIATESIVRLTNTRFENNRSAQFGAGMYLRGNASASIAGSTFHQNQTPARGGGLYAAGSTSLTLTNSVLSSNTALAGGGGSFYDNTTAVITSCTVTSNTTTGNGGGLLAEQFTTLTLLNSLITQNRSLAIGGGVLRIGSFTALNTTFSGNIGNRGGGLYNSGERVVSISACTFDSNTALRGGGGVGDGYLDRITYSNCLFQNNIASNGGADGSGGGIRITSGTAVIGQSRFLNNAALGTNDVGGGGVVLFNAHVTLNDCIVSGNRSATWGGGIAVDRGGTTLATVVVTNTRIESNTAQNGGGYMCRNPSINQLTSVTITGNQSMKDGGGVFVSGSATLVSANLLISNNVATEWGAGVYSNSGVSAFMSTSLVGNHGRTGGALLFNNDSQSTITNCFLLSNTATTRGGAMHCENNSNPRLTQVLAAFNQGGSDGGAFSHKGSSPIYTGVTVANNSATVGGAFSGTSSSAPTITNSVIWGNGGASAIGNDGTSSLSATYSLFEDGATGYNASATNRVSVPSPFVSAGNFRLNACGLAIDAGNNATNTASLDLDGLTRVQNGTVDMGAYEFSGTPTARGGITAGPGGPLTVCVGSAVSAPVSVSGTGPFNYQWYKDAFSSPVASQTTATLTLPSAGLGDTGSYSVVIVDGCLFSFTSAGFSLSVSAGVPPVLTLAANSSVGCVGSGVVLPVTVAGPVTNFQWYRDGQLISGQLSATLTLAGIQPTQAGNYSLVATDTGGCGSATSTAFSLTVRPVPVVTLSFPTGSTVVGPGTGVATITVPAPFTATTMQAFGGTQFDWLAVIDRINGYEIRQVDSNTTGLFTITRTGPFRLTVTDSNGCQRTVEGVIH